jgi:DNA-binding transcriptional ArsR family regulator
VALVNFHVPHAVLGQSSRDGQLRREPTERSCETDSMTAVGDSYCGLYCGACSGRRHGESGCSDGYVKQIAVALNLPQRTVEHWLKKLNEQGRIVFTGSPKAGGYFAAG